MIPNGYGERVPSGMGWYYTSNPQGPINGGSLQGLGLDLADVTGGFSLQTVMLIAGAGLLLFLMMGKGGRELEYRQLVSGTKSKRNELKKRADHNVAVLEGEYDKYRKTGVMDMEKAVKYADNMELALTQLRD